MLHNSYGLIIGIADYQNINSLPDIVLKDTIDISKVLSSPEHCGYPPENLELLTNKNATLKAINKALNDLAKKTDKDSIVFIYISSHGGQIKDGPYSGEYLLPVDVKTNSAKDLMLTAISGNQFTEALNKISAQKMVVIFDCCHAGGIGQIKSNKIHIENGFSETYYESLKTGQGRVILASSRSSEYSYILPNAENSLFTQYLLKGLQGDITSDDGLIRIFDLFEYLQPKVTGNQPNQHPIFKAELEENFPVALNLGGQKDKIKKQANSFRYDAYISYVDQEPDATWVWEKLIPRLEKENLRIAVSGDSESPGVARVINMERGITQSKRTIIILTDNYLNDSMVNFENVLGQTLGIQERTYRLLPIQINPLEENKIPLRLNMLTRLNLAHASRSKREYERLITALQSPLSSM